MDEPGQRKLTLHPIPIVAPLKKCAICGPKSEAKSDRTFDPHYRRWDHSRVPPTRARIERVALVRHSTNRLVAVLGPSVAIFGWSVAVLVLLAIPILERIPIHE